MVDSTFALDGGSAARRWRQKRERKKTRIEAARKKRWAQDQREKRWDLEQRRKARVQRIERDQNQRKAKRKLLRLQIERQDRRAFLKERKIEGYISPGLPYKDLTGKRYGLLVAVRPGGHIKSGSKLWWVRCDCGSPLKEVRGTNLQQGFLRSCGCCGRDGLQFEWHSMKYHRKRAQRYKELARPVSTQLRRIQGKLKPGSRDAQVLFQARCWIMWAELQLGIRKSVGKSARRISGATLLERAQHAQRAARIVKRKGPRKARKKSA